MSEETVKHNLNILVNIKEQPHINNRGHIFLPTLLWFYAAGFQNRLLLDMLESEAERRKLNDNFSEMEKSYIKDDFTSALVYCLLPVYTDVRFVTNRDRVQLFLYNDESKNTTSSWLNMLAIR